MKEKDSLGEALDFFKQNHHFLIIGHKDPDGDCLASQIALYLFLSRIQKKALLVSPGPFDRVSIPIFQPYLPRFKTDLSRKELKKNTVAVVVDCSTLERIGHLAERIKGIPTLVIDHHSATKDFGDIQYYNPRSPSVTLMIEKIIEEMGHEATEVEAKLLFFGFCTDSGFFRHLDAHSYPTFTQLSNLLKRGASPRETFHQMYGGKSLESRKFLARILSRTVPLYDEKLLITYATYDDFSKLSRLDHDSDTLYQQLLSIDRCQVAVYLKEEAPHNYSVGLRSAYSLDVGAIASGFGGGGHKNAAGFMINGDLETIKQEVIRRFSDIF